MTKLLAAMNRTSRHLLCLAAVALVAGCHSPKPSVVPQGQAGYQAIEVPVAAREELYTLAPGDEIAVRVYGEPDLSDDKVLIDAAGNVSLPLIGDVKAQGKSTQELAREIEAAYASNFVRDPRVSVQTTQVHASTIAVEGEVEIPGVYPYAPGATLLTALAQARSPTDTAKLDEIVVFRTIDGQKYAGRFDLREIRAGASPDVPLLPGDIVMVGFSKTRAGLLDFFRAVPLIGYFRPYP